MNKLNFWRARGLLCVLAAVSVCGCSSAQVKEKDSFDVVILGGTSAGVAAAVQTARMGKSVILIEACQHLGGLSSGGLGATDIGNKKAIGGIAREFYHSVYLHYKKESSWVYEKRRDYVKVPEPFRGSAESWDKGKAWWAFEPHVAEKIFNDLPPRLAPLLPSEEGKGAEASMIGRAKVPVVYGERLDLENGVQKEGARITAIKTESGRVYRAKMFIDATYEGDLMAKAGVSYTVGREANSQYNETLDGVQTKHARSHQFEKPVDPYIEPGNPSSGLLPGVHGDGPGAEGKADQRVQAYNFRLCLTDVPENQVPIAKPKDYDPMRYELLLRYYEAGYDQIPWIKTMMPNRKTDINNKDAFSSDNIGANYRYPEADYAEREKIINDHVSYQMGLMWTLANHPRVPADVREEVGKWGLAKDEFIDTPCCLAPHCFALRSKAWGRAAARRGWSRQLYVREARRMVSDYVMTENDCRGKTRAADPVGLAAYTMDSHNTQRYVDESGHARNEGDVQVGGFPPYPVSYRSIIPKQDQCQNLLVPVCLSASHIAFGSIRMEPVFMVLGQSAATAASLAIEEGKAVQQVDYRKLRKRLLKDGQILEWNK
jgi:hypothetical protein